MRLLTTWRLKSALPGGARRGRHGVWPSSATGIDPDCAQRKVLLTNVFCRANVFAACRDDSAEPGTSSSAHARWCWRRSGSSRSRGTRAAPAFGTFASAETPKRSIPSVADPHSVTRAAAGPTPEAFLPHLYRLPMYMWYMWGVERSDRTGSEDDVAEAL